MGNIANRTAATNLGHGSVDTDIMFVSNGRSDIIMFQYVGRCVDRFAISDHATGKEKYNTRFKYDLGGALMTSAVEFFIYMWKCVVLSLLLNIFQ